jgi:hypothetical protein
MPLRVAIGLLACLALVSTCPSGFGAVVTASSQSDAFPAAAAFDRDRGSRWSSEASDDQWLQVDFGREIRLVGLILLWEVAYGSAYDVSVSTNGADWTTVFSTDEGRGARDEVQFAPVSARQVRLNLRRRGTNWGYSLFEVIPRTDVEPWGEGEPGGFFARTSSSSLFVPAAWSNEQPFIRLCDFKEGFALSINGKEIASFPAGARRTIVEVSEALDYGSVNEIAVSGIGGVVTGRLVLAGSEALWREGRLALCRRDARAGYEMLARVEPEGWFPRWLTGRQGFWTVVGVDGDFKESLLADDGTFEPYKSFSIAPFLYEGGRLLSREDGTMTQHLEQGSLPIPSVTWTVSNLSLRVTACADGPPGASVSYVRYTIRNHAERSVSVRLFLALRPFEVNPPWQWGGVTRLHSLERNNRYVAANEFQVYDLTRADAFGCAAATDGDVVGFLAAGEIPARKAVRDPDELASAALGFDMELDPGSATNIYIAVPLHRSAPDPDPEACFVRSQAAWQARLAALPFRVPDPAVSNALRASVAYMLVNRDGPAIQPGSRSYEASWMRDGAMTSAALLRMGLHEEVREFLVWFRRFQFDDGRVPAIVIIGRNEVNPVREYDSQGQFVHAAADYYRFTGDKAFLEDAWPALEKSLLCLERLRKEEDRPELLERETDRRYFGILPKSVSHEGYYPEPGNHSYWDDFWALRGWRDAYGIARLVGGRDDPAWIRREHDALQEGVSNSVRETMRLLNLEHVPGCAELGDFDPSATAIAVLCEVDDVLPDDALRHTFFRYLSEMRNRSSPGWSGSFSPYEFRLADALVRRGEAEAGLDVFTFLMEYRRPAGWSQWPEALYVPERTPGFIGDMPHTWVASGFVNALRTCLLFEHDEELVIGAGLPLAWLDSGEAGVSNAPTYWGRVSYTAKKDGARVVVEVTGEAHPPKGFLVHAPVGMAPREVRRVAALPCVVEFTPPSWE